MTAVQTQVLRHLEQFGRVADGRAKAAYNLSPVELETIIIELRKHGYQISDEKRATILYGSPSTFTEYVLVTDTGGGNERHGSDG